MLVTRLRVGRVEGQNKFSRALTTDAMFDRLPRVRLSTHELALQIAFWANVWLQRRWENLHGPFMRAVIVLLVTIEGGLK